MPVFRLPREHLFPPVQLAEKNGLLAVGGDLSPPRLLAAYALGIFPWYSRGEPILWWSPDPRLVLYPDQLHVPRSLDKTLRRDTYVITFDRAFSQVMAACARPRPGQEGTWITPAMRQAYEKLHHLGHAHSAESWRLENGRAVLAGGLYGVALGGCFFGESMFARAPDASKAAFVTLTRQLRLWGFTLVDCQVATDHLLRFGARDEPRERFLDLLQEALALPGRPGSWQGLETVKNLPFPAADPPPA